MNKRLPSRLPRPDRRRHHEPPRVDPFNAAYRQFVDQGFSPESAWAAVIGELR